MLCERCGLRAGPDFTVLAFVFFTVRARVGFADFFAVARVLIGVLFLIVVRFLTPARFVAVALVLIRDFAFVLALVFDEDFALDGFLVFDVERVFDLRAVDVDVVRSSTLALVAVFWSKTMACLQAVRVAYVGLFTISLPFCASRT